MVATVAVIQWYGATPTVATVSTSGSTGSTRFQVKDTYNATDLSYPTPIPSSGTRTSYYIHMGLKIDSGVFTQINNAKFYCTFPTAWALGTGGSIVIGNRDSGPIGCPIGSYVVAAGTEGSIGNSIEVSHTYYSAQTAKILAATLWTAAAPATLDTTSYTTYPTTLNAAVLQIKVGINASAGSLTAGTLIFSYDEV